MDVLGDRPAGRGDELELEGPAVRVRGGLEECHPLSGKGILYGLTPVCHHVSPRPACLFLSSRCPVYSRTFPGVVRQTLRITPVSGPRVSISMPCRGSPFSRAEGAMEIRLIA